MNDNAFFLFLLNTGLVLLDASLGYHTAPRLMAFLAEEEPEAAEAGIRSTRAILPLVVALYMFFNCLGYFQARLAYLLTVSGLLIADLALQLFLRRRARKAAEHQEDPRL